MSATSYPTILIVDDEPLLLSLLSTALTQQGFRVLTAAGGPRALEMALRHAGEIDLVLLDVCMPILDGPETLAELRRLDPGIVACFMSGNTGRYTCEQLASLGGVRLFEKPFRLDEMTQTLWQLAQQRARRSA